MNDQTMWYQLGKRDAVVETFMLIRTKGERQALHEIAKLLNSDSENLNPHAKWYLENYKIND